MSDLSLVTDNYLPTASETFADNLSGSIAAGAATVPVNSAAEYADGETVVLTVEPGTANEATFVGKKDTGVNQFIECIWTEGNTAVGHDAGVTIIDYDSATHYNLLSKALQLIMNQDGTLKDDPIRTALGLSDASTDGWEVFPYTFSVSSGYNKGNNEFDLNVANQDVRTILSKGMKLRLERSTTAPTQCMDLEASSSQYASRTAGSVTGVTFTDDFTLECWVKPESYGVGALIARHNGSTGFWLQVNATGQVVCRSQNGAGAKDSTSTQSVSLGRWTHLAASQDVSGAAYAMYFNGISVSITTSGAGTGITQAGDLMVGYNATVGGYFDGKISDVRIWNAVRTQTQIRDNMNQQLVGTETNLISYFKLSGNLNDSTTNANNLTGSGGAVATDTDNPMSSTQYAVITNVSYSAPNSTVTVFTGSDHIIPNMTLTSPYYSNMKAPYGFPVSKAKWNIIVPVFSTINASGTVASTTYNPGGLGINVPSGSWKLGYNIFYAVTPNAAIPDMYAGLQTSSSAFVAGEQDMTNRLITQGAATSNFTGFNAINHKFIELSVATPFYALVRNGSNMSSNQIRGNNSTTIPETTYLYAECAYI